MLKRRTIDSVIICERLIIQPLDSLQYLFEIQALFASPTAMRYYENGSIWSHKKTLKTIKSKIERAKQFEEKLVDSLPWWIVKLKNENFVGLIGTFKKETLSAPGTYHIDVCCISKPEFWGKYIMTEAMAHLGMCMAPWLKEHIHSKMPIRFSTHENNKASERLGKLFMENKKELFYMKDHPNGPRYRWSVDPFKAFITNPNSKIRDSLKNCYKSIFNLRNVRVVPQFVIPSMEDFFSMEILGEEMVEVEQCPTTLKTGKGGKYTVKMNMEIRKLYPVHVIVSVVDIGQNLVPLYHSKSRVAYVRKFMSEKEDDTISFLLRLGDNPGGMVYIRCQVYRYSNLISQVVHCVNTTRKRNRSNSHQAPVLISNYESIATSEK